MYAPSHSWIRPAGEYNTLRIIMYENKVAHYGNGAKLVEYVIGDSDWTARYSMSKYNSFPLYGDIHAGKLFLQDHASHVWYRNIKIMPLANDPWSDPSFLWPDQDVPVLAPRARDSRAFRMDRSSGGALVLSAGIAREWNLRLYDAAGRGRADLQGYGTRVQADGYAPAGIYLSPGGIDAAGAGSGIPFPVR
jgi:hypothetical protein